MKPYHLYILILFVFFSCTEEVPLDTNFKEQTFIYGILTNESENLQISIKKSVPIKSTSQKPKAVKNAKVTLYTKNSGGNSSMVTNAFVEVNGVYTSQSISPIIGNFYWIEVVLQDGTKFKSNAEQLKSPVAIKNMTKVNGFARVSFKDPVNEKNFYQLTVESSSNMWVDKLSNDILFNGNDNAFIEVETLIGNIIKATLANFNYNTYQFYLNVEIQQNALGEAEEEGGDPSQLFAPPPVHLEGNILNINTNKKALGNFGVVSISHTE